MIRVKLLTLFAQGNNRYIFRESYKTPKYILWEKRGILGVEEGGRVNIQSAPKVIQPKIFSRINGTLQI